MPRNLESIEENDLVIESVTPFDPSGERIEERRFIARVPVETGSYTTVTGNELNLTVCPLDSDNRQKLILSGPDLPMKKQRGKHGQFKHKQSREELRRVVEFPEGPLAIQRHQVGINHEIIFRLEDRKLREHGNIFVDRSANQVPLGGD